MSEGSNETQDPTPPPERRARIWELFNQAVDLPPPEQRALLDAACANEPDLRAEVERLLAGDARLGADKGATDFLKSPVLRRPPDSGMAALFTPAGQPALPARIGRYRIIRLLGEGGMGAVYEAEQDNPRRSVALKVLRPGLLSGPLLRRFDHEAQILGRLHHPGISAIYEAALAEDGRPFFAMEFIRGLPLDEFVRRHELDTAACLRLMIRVCDAVQHAHEHGVIHRDLKPGNILVEETGQPRVLDFGIARATDADLQTTTARTEAGQLLGTLHYMSPEQAAGDPAALDRRSDVYALGLILFELLAGRLPYHLEHLPWPEVARVIREQEPLRLGSIDARWRGDVETIVAKALEKDRARRYPAAADLAADIRRHLDHEPIQARPPSALYQLGKFARRHKALVGGVAGVVAALLLGLIGTTFFAMREAEQRGEAEHNARLANEEMQEARHQAYRARIAAAAAALENHDVDAAARHLDAAPAALRDWEWRHLRSRLDDSNAVFPTPVTGTRFMPHSTGGLRRVILGEQSVRVVDEQGHIERTFPFPHPQEGVWVVAATPDGLLILDRVAGGGARVRDETGKERLSLPAPAGAAIAQVGASSNRQWLAITSNTTAGYSTAVYDSAGKERARFPPLHAGQIWALTLSPDGTRLASGSDDGTARLWDVTTGQPIGGALRHPGQVKVLSAAFRPDGARFLTASADGTVCQWDAQTGAAVEPPYERHAGEVWTATYSPDGQWIASGGTDRTVRLWRATGRQEALVLHGHTGTVTLLEFSEDGRWLGSLSEDGTARTWEADPETSLPVLRGHRSYVYPVAYSPDGRWIASGSWDGTVRLWDALTGELGAVLPHSNIVWALAFSPDGSWLVSTVYNDANLWIWDVATARLRRKIPALGKAMRLGTAMRLVAVSPDGARIAATDWDEKAERDRTHVIDSVTGRELGSVEGIAFAYSPDGKWLAGRARDNKTLLLWDAQTHEVAASFHGHENEIHGVAFSPDGRYLASCSLDRSARVWHIDGGQCQILRGHTDEVFAVAFHPSGARLATAGRDRAVWLWDPAKGEEVARLQGHASYVWSLAFRPDGKSLVSGSGDKTVRLWDTDALRVRHDLRREAERLRPEAERLVARLFAELREPAQVVARLRADESLSEPLRRAALRAVMRRCAE